MKPPGIAGFVVGAGVLTAVYVFTVRRVFRRWGTADNEVAREMPGDDIVAKPRWAMTHAVTIDAPPEAVWPWLAQLGYRRGGLYSYDRLDMLAKILDAPSADQILPEFQHLETGDVIPLGAGPNWPVAAVNPPLVLVLAPDVSAAPGTSVSWAFRLYPLEDSRTRLVTRVRATYPLRSVTAAIMTAMDPAAFLMTRRMLLGIKERAERLADRERALAGSIRPRVAA